MRITLVIGTLNGGGAERVCVNLANAWVKHGWQVTILTTSQGSNPPAYSVDQRVKCRDLGKPRLPSEAEMSRKAIGSVIRGLIRNHCGALITELGLIAILRYGILQTRPDVVVPILEMTNIRVIAAMYETGLPVIAVEQTDAARVSIGKWQSIRKALYRSAHAVVAPQPSIAAWLARNGAPAYAIHNPLVAPPRMRVERNGGRRRLVTLARLSSEKRPDLLVRAFARIAGDFPEWDLEMHGDGPLRPFITRYIAELAPGRIHLHWFENAPYTILDGADLFVSASWVEGFGNAIWEALACGVPVVAMDAGSPLRALIRDGIDGLIVNTNSTPALAAALAKLLSDDAARRTMAARAPEVVARFPIEASLQKWHALLNQVVTGSTAAPSV
jgi:GalNAc-alpha-(1->4)-GalNAc-alpha-(1->3)-diNAcBac-PP-undecaprenol alpha-1,4-N-acetyl-D-galactosaminyltransferase